MCIVIKFHFNRKFQIQFFKKGQGSMSMKKKKKIKKIPECSSLLFRSFQDLT